MGFQILHQNRFKVLGATSGTYMVLNAVGGATFCFLTVILGFTAAKKLGSDPIVMAIVGGILIYPSIISGRRAKRLLLRLPSWESQPIWFPTPRQSFQLLW